MRHVLLYLENIHVFELGSITKHTVLQLQTTARLHEGRLNLVINFKMFMFTRMAEKQNH